MFLVIDHEYWQTNQQRQNEKKTKKTLLISNLIILRAAKAQEKCNVHRPSKTLGTPGLNFAFIILKAKVHLHFNANAHLIFHLTNSNTLHVVNFVLLSVRKIFQQAYFFAGRKN